MQREASQCQALPAFGFSRYFSFLKGMGVPMKRRNHGKREGLSHGHYGYQTNLEKYTKLDEGRHW